MRSLNALVYLIAAFSLSGNIPGNLLAKLIGRGYEIPKESSLYSFSPIIMNWGSGEWCLMGEDEENIYLVREKGYEVLHKKVFFEKLYSGIFCAPPQPLSL